MKFFAALIAFAAVVCVALADQKNTETKNKEHMLSSSYGGGASYSAPPCPKNYLFSCQPNLAPVPCAPGGGYAGAYSQQVPQYIPYPYAQQYGQ